MCIRDSEILGRIKKEEVEFTELVDKWERQEVVNTFLPLIFLDHERKIRAIQEEIFKEIYIKRAKNNNQDKGRGLKILRRKNGAQKND